MGEGFTQPDRALALVRQLLVMVMIFGVVGLAFSLGQPSVSGLAIRGADAQTYTKAFCAVDGRMRHCEDKLVASIGGEEYISEDSLVSGKADFFGD